MSSDRTVFVGGISWKANEENLKSFFSTFGTVTDCKIIVDKNSNKSKGYGFVTFEDPEIAEKIKKSKDLNFMGKTMNASDAYRKNDGTKKVANNIPGSNYDHPGYQSPPYSVPYGAIPIPYYVPSYNPVSYVPYVYPYGYGWSPGSTPDYYLYQPYDYDETYDEDDNGGDNGEGEIEGGKGSKDSSSGEETTDENASNTANNTADNQSSTENKVSDTPGEASDNIDKHNIIREDNENSNNSSNNQKVDGQAY